VWLPSSPTPPVAAGSSSSSLGRLAISLHDDFGGKWCFIRVGDPGEGSDLTAEGFGIEPFDIAVDADVECTLDIDLDKAADLWRASARRAR
jgi:hypothetical protein